MAAHAGAAPTAACQGYCSLTTAATRSILRHLVKGTTALQRRRTQHPHSRRGPQASRLFEPAADTRSWASRHPVPGPQIPCPGPYAAQLERPRGGRRLVAGPRLGRRHPGGSRHSRLVKGTAALQRRHTQRPQPPCQGTAALQRRHTQPPTRTAGPPASRLFEPARLGQAALTNGPGPGRASRASGSRRTPPGALRRRRRTPSRRGRAVVQPTVEPTVF